MKNLAKLQLQQTRQKAKVKPMASARTARAVPQMRRAIKEITGRKDGGAMTKNPTEKLKSLKNPKAKDRFAQGSAARLEKALDKLIEGAPKGSFKDMLKKLKFRKDKLAPQDINRAKEVLTMTQGKRSGGVIRPKPTFKGKVLKPKPIKSRGIGMAIRGFGKAFKKGK
jgi:hypothetical protein